MDPKDNNEQPLPSLETETPTSIQTPAPAKPIEVTPYDFGTQPVDPVKPSRRKKISIITLITLVLAGVVGTAVWFFILKGAEPQLNQAQPTQQTTEKKVETEPISPELAKFITPTTGETWLEEPKDIAKQGWFKYPDTEQNTTYYEVGKRGENTIYVTSYFELGEVVRLFEKNPAGVVSYISRPDNIATYNETDEASNATSLKNETFVSTIVIDSKTSYDSLSIPKEIPIDNGYKLTRTSSPDIGSVIATEKGLSVEQRPVRKTIKQLGKSSVYRSDKNYSDTQLTSIGYGVITPLQNYVTLSYEPITNNASTYEWTTGDSKIGGKYYPITRGCGGSFTSVTRGDSVKESDVTQVGKTKEGVAIYEFKDPNYITVTKAYDEFVAYIKDDPTSPYKNITKAEYLKKHTLITTKDKFDQWLVYLNSELAPIAGCAKPVVYLYPTQPTNVTVKVGANVKISDPQYNPTTGWKAFARPSGLLTVDGRNYDSLFWEGPGYGEYPAITSGTVVPQAQAISTIKSQLAAQGLNAKESEDFVTYWQDKLPNKPYLRLTWFNTAQLDQLAPLSVSPRPDTSIRVFLDMAGLDQPISIKPQTFNAPARTGFTLVEWGGLATFKLY